MAAYHNAPGARHGRAAVISTIGHHGIGMNNPLLYRFGGIGALIYPFPMYLAAASADPPDKFAFTAMLFAVFVGAILAPVVVVTGGASPYSLSRTRSPLR